VRFKEKSQGLEKIGACDVDQATKDRYLYFMLKDFHDQCFQSVGRPCREKDGKVECD